MSQGDNHSIISDTELIIVLVGATGGVLPFLMAVWIVRGGRLFGQQPPPPRLHVTVFSRTSSRPSTSSDATIDPPPIYDPVRPPAYSQAAHVPPSAGIRSGTDFE
ncbi:hypothetical protein OQA88_7913 [Cercophora sp. LCS_1]